MPTITLNKTVLERLIGKKLSLEQLKDRISMLGTDLEKIEGNEIVVEVFPNRPDMLSEQGFARALSSFIGVKTGLRSHEVKKSGHKLFVKNTPSYWPYAIAFIAHGLKLDSEKVRELIQLQEKIGITMLRNRKKGGIGLYPLQKLQFPITFEGRKPEQIMFRPLEYSRILTAREILREHKKGKEYGHLMEKWDTFTVFVDNNGTIMSMPPIINSHEMGKIDETSSDLFIECTGKDLNVITKAINIFAASLSDMGAAIESIEVHYKGQKWDVPNLSPSKIKLDLDYVNRRLGLKLKEKEAKALLERMGYGSDKGTVLIPAYRADILHQVDIMEDIAIAHGYENFKEEIPKVATIAEENDFERFSRSVRDILVELGMIEVKNYHLMMEGELNGKMDLKGKIIPLKNSVGDYNYLRNSLLPSLLKNLLENQHREYPQRIFEIGKVFEYGKTETGIQEENRLGIMLCHEKADFTEIRQIVDAFTRDLGSEIKIKESRFPSFMDGRAGYIILKGEKIGIIGEIHPQVLTNWKIEMPVVGLEMDLEKVFEVIRKNL